jgi:hypothetical protein
MRAALAFSQQTERPDKDFIFEIKDDQVELETPTLNHNFILTLKNNDLVTLFPKFFYTIISTTFSYGGFSFFPS